MAPTLESSFLQHIPRDAPCLVACSGGLDSTVLLHLAQRLMPARTRVLHVHHGLHPDADLWGERVRALCIQWSVPFAQERVDARPAAGESPEESARRARYGAFARHLAQGESLLLAQHADDQAETVLLQLLRGAGVKGLSGMPTHVSFAGGYLLRPLLGHRRCELLRYAEEHRLRWSEDPTNRDAGFDRNFLRHEILPQLAQRWPSATVALARSAGHCAQAARIVDERALALLVQVRGTRAGTLSVAALRQLADGDCDLALRAFLAEHGFRSPPMRTLACVARELLLARDDRNPCVRWPEGELRRYRGEVYALRVLPEVAIGFSRPWSGACLTLPDGRRLVTRPSSKEASGLACWDWSRVTVRYPVGGERLRLPGAAHARRLSTLFQDAGVPPWERVRTPLIFYGDTLAAVGDTWLAGEYLEREGRESFRVVLEASQDNAAAGAGRPDGRTDAMVPGETADKE